MGGGWTMVLRRENDDIRFDDRSYAELLHGFGNFKSDFFLGLEKLHALTSSRCYRALIAVQFNNETVSRKALYSEFKVEYENGIYKMSLSDANFDGHIASCVEAWQYSQKEPIVKL